MKQGIQLLRVILGIPKQKAVAETFFTPGLAHVETISLAMKIFQIQTQIGYSQHLYSDMHRGTLKHVNKVCAGLAAVLLCALALPFNALPRMSE